MVKAAVRMTWPEFSQAILLRHQQAARRMVPSAVLPLPHPGEDQITGSALVGSLLSLSLNSPASGAMTHFLPLLSIRILSCVLGHRDPKAELSLHWISHFFTGAIYLVDFSLKQCKQLQSNLKHPSL